MHTPAVPKQTILIVDDTPANVGILVEYLEDCGFEVVVAQDGAEGLQRAQYCEPDLILLDVLMPGMDGFETCRQLKALDAVKDIPVIFMTALTDSGDKLAGFAAGAVDYVTKPFQIEEVRARVDAQLSLHSARNQLAASNLRLQQEIAQHKSTEQTLRLMNSAIASSINAIFLTDCGGADNPIVYVNPAFERMTGYTAAEVIGTNSRFLQGPEPDQEGAGLILAALREAGEAHAVLRSYRKDGSAFWSEWYIAPVREAGAAATHCVGVLNDISKAKQLEEQLQQRANHDLLTGLPNRVLLLDRIEQAMAGASRQQTHAFVAFIDLDHFKDINDSLGHEAGDTLLRAIATRLQACVREFDTVARLGGDEFVVVLQDECVEGALPILQRIIERIARPVTLMGEPHAVTCSIGVSVYPQDGGDAETLIKHADTAMYRAKEIGRNSFQFFMREMNTRLNDRLQLEADLRRALEHGEFELYYQPQVDLRSGAVVGSEALIRWHHPRHGLVMPARFIGVAEESDLILHIGRWVVTQACRQNQAWIAAGLPALPVAVNLAARQFDRQDIPALLEQVLRETGLAPALLEVELTESASMRDPERSMEIMARLKRIGVGVAIDDFGTGYSNLTYLKKFPVDKLKLDRSFIQDIADNPQDNAISNAVIKMGHSLHLKVIAEGVERAGQLAILRALGCDQLQGHLFSPALPAAQFADLLRCARRLEAPPADHPRGPPTLLLLDDEALVLAALARELAGRPYRILQADNVKDAFELLAMHRVDVILSDQRMPDMSGLEFLERVRKIHPAIVGVMLSGHADQDMLLSAINARTVFKFLRKPWQGKELEAALEAAFEKARRAGAAVQ